MNLDDQRRYARQIALPEIGITGQQKLRDARVLVIGAGGLGAPLITYLASTGIGHLGIIDPDRVELSNLPRQTIFETGDIGRLKVDAARDRVTELNPDCAVTTYPFTLDAENAAEIISQYHVVADGCDQFVTRFLVNKICLTRSVPLVSAAISGFHGQVMNITKGSACYQCIVHEQAADERTCNVGILAPFAGMIGCMQALEVLRIILGFPALIGKMAVIDGLTNSQRIVNLQRDPACPACGHAVKA
jgi:molybdopterin/thiamine biosynthesis adenylyltransferase